MYVCNYTHEVKENLKDNDDSHMGQLRLANILCFTYGIIISAAWYSNMGAVP